MWATSELLENRQFPLPEEHVLHARRILQRLREVGSRRARIDPSRALDVLGHFQGRTPRSVKEIGQLLNPRLRVLTSVFRPIERTRPGVRRPGGTGSGRPGPGRAAV